MHPDAVLLLSSIYYDGARERDAERQGELLWGGKHTEGNTGREWRGTGSTRAGSTREGSTRKGNTRGSLGGKFQGGNYWRERSGEGSSRGGGGRRVFWEGNTGREDGVWEARGRG